MNLTRQMSWRYGRATGARTRSAVDYCIIATVSIKSDPSKFFAHAMFWVKYIETVGTGLNELLDACAAAGLKRPTIEANDIHFRLIIWRPTKKTINEPLNEPLKVKVGNATTQSVFEVVVSNPGIKQKDLCDLMGISTVSAKRRHLALLDEHLSRVAAMSIGGATRIDDVTRESFASAAREVGMRPQLVLGRLDALSHKVLSSAGDLAAELSVKWPSAVYAKIQDVIRHHVEHVRM